MLPSVVEQYSTFVGMMKRGATEGITTEVTGVVVVVVTRCKDVDFCDTRPKIFGLVDELIGTVVDGV